MPQHQGITNPNSGGYSHAYTILALDKPIDNLEVMPTATIPGAKKINLNTKMISLIFSDPKSYDDLKKYEGKKVTITINPKKIIAPSDTGLPLAQPRALEGEIIVKNN